MTKKILSEYLQIALGSAILATSIYLFFIPHNLVVGGVSGLGIILLYYSESYWPFIIPVWLTNLAINIPLLIIALKAIGLKFIAKTIFSTLFLAFVLFLLEEYVTFTLPTDLFLAAIMGGVTSGIGVGIVYRQFATTGGSVLVATLLQRIMRHIPMPRIMMIIDWAIILAGFFVFGSERTMYAIISIFVCTKTMDYVLEGLHFAKAAFIISENSEEIAQEVTKQMERGLTSLNGKGAYTGQDKNVLLCVVSKREIVRLKEIVTNIDKKAFVIVADVREVLGEGFRDFDSKL